MTRRVRLTDSTDQVLKLKSDKISLSDIESRATHHSKGKGRSVDVQIMSFEKDKVSRLVEDFKLLRKELKRLGVKTKLALHLSETEEFKKEMARPLKDKDVPSFLRKDRR